VSLAAVGRFPCWGDLPAYVIGPLIGGVVAAVVYDAVACPRAFDEVEPAQGTQGDIEGQRDGATDVAGTGS
jgi:hypothetical protein